MNIVVFGLGYVGTITSACLAGPTRAVWGVDPDTTKVGLIQSGRSPVVEPGIEELIGRVTAAGWLQATTDPVEALRDADVALLCVGTPSTPTGGADMQYMERVAHEIGTFLATSERFLAVVVRSTVPPGTVNSLVAETVASASGKTLGVDFGVAMCPEFLREGSSIEDFHRPPFSVIGADDPRVIAMLTELFSMIDRPLHVVEIPTAEGLKYACNAFHAVKVSFTNELARLYRTMGVDAREVMKLFVQDDQLNLSPAYLRPGFAFGGSCLPKDLRSLLDMARRQAVELPVLAGTIRTNDIVIGDLVKRVLADERPVVTLLGLSFKAQTDDLRESPYVELAEQLLGRGVDLRIYDPIVQPAKLFGANLRYVKAHLPHLQKLLHNNPEAALEGCTLAIVANAGSEAIDELLAVKPSRVIDLNGRLGDAVESLPGYEGMGW